MGAIAKATFKTRGRYGDTISSLSTFSRAPPLLLWKIKYCRNHMNMAPSTRFILTQIHSPATVVSVMVMEWLVQLKRIYTHPELDALTFWYDRSASSNKVKHQRYNGHGLFPHDVMDLRLDLKATTKTFAGRIK